MREPKNILKQSAQDLDDLKAFVEANPNLDQDMRASMADFFATILAVETAENPTLINFTNFITNLTVTAAIFGYRKALQDNPIIGKEVK